MKGQCTSCHKDVSSTHAQWLPNTERHLEAISCPACHSPGATRRVNLRLYEGGDAPQQAEKVGVPTFVKMANSADVTGAGLTRAHCGACCRSSTGHGAGGKTMLRGRLEVQTGVQAHQLGEQGAGRSRNATPATAGRRPFQTVTVSMAGPDGRPRHDARRVKGC